MIRFLPSLMVFLAAPSQAGVLMLDVSIDVLHRPSCLFTGECQSNFQVQSFGTFNIGDSRFTLGQYVGDVKYIDQTGRPYEFSIDVGDGPISRHIVIGSSLAYYYRNVSTGAVFTGWAPRGYTLTLDGKALSVVPEPSIWLTMLAGFMIVGAEMRQRRLRIKLL